MSDDGHVDLTQLIWVIFLLLAIVLMLRLLGVRI